LAADAGYEAHDLLIGRASLGGVRYAVQKTVLSEEAFKVGAQILHREGVAAVDLRSAASVWVIIWK
jgi:hypothetical protein